MKALYNFKGYRKQKLRHLRRTVGSYLEEAIRMKRKCMVGQCQIYLYKFSCIITYLKRKTSNRA